MNRTKKFFYNSVSTGLLQIVNMIIGFLLPRLILNFYGSEINGLVTSITQFISYFNIVEAGLASAAIYALYRPLAKNDTEEISEVVSTTKNFYYKSGYIFTALVIILSILYPIFVKVNELTMIDVFFLVIILGSSGFLDFFTLSKYRVLLTADQKVYIISIASIIYYIINTAIIFLMVHLGFGIVLVRFAATFAILVRSAILYFYTRKYYSNISFNKKPKKELLKKRWDALYLQLLGSVQLGAPIIILTIFSSTANLITVSIYSIYNMVLQGINNMLSIFISGLSSSFGEIIVSENLKKLQDTSQEFDYIYYDIITLIYSVSFLLIMPFIKLYCMNIKDANYYIPIIGFLFVLNGLLYNMKTPQGMLVISAGLYKETKMQSTIQGLIIIVFGILLVPKYGIIGILIANILSNIYRDIDLMFFIPKNLTKLPVTNTTKRYLKIIILSIIIVLTGKSISINIDSYFDFIKSGFLYCIIALAIILIYDFILDRQYLIKILKRFKVILGVKNDGDNK